MSGRKLYTKLTTSFCTETSAAIKRKFEIDVTTEWSIFECRYVTSRTDGQPLTQPQWDYLDGFSNGYSAATSMVKI